MTFELSSDRVAETLALLHEIGADKRVAFRARLKHFQRLGFPEGVNVGKGKSAKYGAGHVITLALALELAELGLTPERIVTLIRGDYFPVFAAVKGSTDAILSGEWKPTRSGSAGSIFLYLDPSALASLRDRDPAGTSFEAADASTVAQHLAHVTSNFERRRLAIVNVTALVDALVLLLNGGEQQAFLKDAEVWARIGKIGWPDRKLISAGE
jgi:hypothetical protein